jgi:hypothetical protein
MRRPKTKLPIFELLTPVDELDVRGELLSDAADEKIAGGIVKKYGIPEGTLIMTVWNGRLHEVIYQTPRRTPDGIVRDRNEWLFKHYGDGHAWREIVDNGFGKVYDRVDGERYALWSYMMDISTFGTKEFHAVRW